MKLWNPEILKTKSFWTALIGIAGVSIGFAFGEVKLPEALLAIMGFIQSINIRSGMIQDAPIGLDSSDLKPIGGQ